MGQGYVQAGLLSCENDETRVPTLWLCAEGNITNGANREPAVNPAQSENLCMYGISMRENREIPRLSVETRKQRIAQTRPRP